MSNFKKLVNKSKEGNIHAFSNLFQGHTMPVCHIQISRHYVIFIASVFISVYLLLLWCVLYHFNE